MMAGERFAAAVALTLALGWPVQALAQGREADEIVDAVPGAERDDTRFQLSTGIDISTGDYGDRQSTEIIVIPLLARYRAADWLTLGVGGNWLRIDGPNLVLGPDNRPLPGFPVAKRARSGLGDVSLSATVRPQFGEGSPWSLDVSGRVKLPTGKDGLTTGETDYTLGASLSYATGKWAPFVDVDLQIPGDPPLLDLREAPSVSLGVVRAFDKGGVIVSYDWDRSIVRGFSDSHSLFGAYFRPLTQRLDLTGYAIVGLSQGAPAAEGGLLLTAKF